MLQRHENPIRVRWRNIFVFVLTFALTLGTVWFVRAVAPGAVTNPTFSPQSDDVQFVNKLGSSIEAIENTATGSDLVTVQATCAAGQVVTGGGCSSTVASQWRYCAYDGPSAGGEGWTCDCRRFDSSPAVPQTISLRAYALCARP